MLERIAQYEISAELGHGGFGRVYKAWDPKVGRDVAIKTLTDARDLEQNNRFRAEAAAAGNLRHTNIVTIYEFGEWEGTPYLVMEYLPGADLSRLIKQGASIGVLEATTIMNQVAAGLGYAHNHGVIHRDVKPANIMVLPDGIVKIMDFGIARVNSDSQPHLTKTGFILGTLPYLPPEQFESERSYDALCDIWAYGVVYYELLTGQNPFKFGGDAAIMHRITAVDPPPIRQVRRDCPEELERLIQRLLMKNREDRYQSLEDVAFDSGSILQELRKGRASDLQKVVERLIGQDEIAEAQIAVRQILELDPSNFHARRWRDDLRERAREKGVKVRVQNLIVSADAAAGQRKFEEAVQFLQSALELNPQNTSVRQRIERLRREQERERHLSTLLAQASEDIDKENLSNALFLASEAAAADPESEAAKALLKRIQVLTDLRSDRRKLEAGISAADDLIAGKAYEQALTLLADLRSSFPDHPQIWERMENVRRLQAGERLRQRLTQGISTARGMLAAERFAEAVSHLEAMCVEFSGETSVRELRALAIKQRDAHIQRAEAESIARQAWSLAKAGVFDAGLKLVDEGLIRFPSDPILAKVRGTIRAEQVAHEEKSEVKATVDLGRGLLEDHRFDDAAAALQSGLARFPSQPELAALLAEVHDKQRHASEVTIQERAEPSRRAVEPEPHAVVQPASREAEIAPIPPPQTRGIARLLVWGAAAGAAAFLVSVGLISHRSSSTSKSRLTSTEAPVVAPQRVESPSRENDSKKTSSGESRATKSVPVETKSKTAKTEAAVDESRTKTTKTVETVASKLPIETKVSARDEGASAVVPPVRTNPIPAPIETVSNKPWRGDDSGNLTWRGGSLAPGASVDLSKAGGLGGGNRFPWLVETKVQVQVVSPPNVIVEVQPSRGNNWNLIRLRNNGRQAAPLVALSWQIIE